MKVLLKQDVKKIGKKGEIHEVSDGYARNYLMPRKLAAQADASAVNEVETKKQAKEFHDAETLAAAKELCKKLDGKTFTVKAKAGAGGKLFGSVTSTDIAKIASEHVGEAIDKRKVVLNADIKAFGKFEAEIKVYSQISAKITVEVTDANQ